MLGILSIIFISLSAVAANLVPIEYSDSGSDFCSCKALVDRDKNDPEEVKGALDFHRVSWGDGQTYLQQKQKLLSVKLPKSLRWEKIRAFYLEEAEFTEYLKNKEKFLATNDKSHLLHDFRGQKLSEKCSEIAEVLGDKTKTTSYFKKLVPEFCQSNKDPALCRKRRLQSKDQRQLVLSSWEICVWGQWSRKPSEQEDLHEAVKEIKKLLVNQNCVCDEP